MEIGQDPSSFGSQVGVASKIRQGQTAAIPPVGSADRSRKVETTIVEGQVLFAHQHQQRVAQAELRDNVIAGHYLNGVTVGVSTPSVRLAGNPPQDQAPPSATIRER